MIRRIIAASLVTVLVGSAASVASAQSLRKSVDRAAVTAASAAAAESKWAAMPPAYKWTGIALLGIGAADVVLTAALNSGGDIRMCPLWDTNCSSSTGVYVQGAMLMGAGAALLAVGSAKASSSITPTRGGFVFRQRVTF